MPSKAFPSHWWYGYGDVIREARGYGYGSKALLFHMGYGYRCKASHWGYGYRGKALQSHWA